ncbi:HDOD domain-containing protein [Teredinibacter sp. KSP-S5-2]|uniref:HDOD domain-containing protein n=1 Tax=Teredinibacter sp. KSP-S5-2 TaxID=3034506 RepID=UPI0029345B2C|nr:HDOD domain-containing protein [Teredinibacter sp. KSP-S5-2]WNO11578.1 HDOD domain-containing protein [Teredinibacter sp. KSP-S5-2]
MSFSLKTLFGRKTEQDPSRITVIEPQSYSIEHSQHAFFRYLYPEKTSRPLTVPQKLVIDVVKSSLAKKNTRQKSVPHLPTVIPKLLRTLKDPDASARDFVAIINKDPAMSAAVLKLANSVYFNPVSHKISDIEPAVVKLGIDGLRSVLSAAVMQPVLQQHSPYFSMTGQKIWQHSLVCAVTCELIAKHRGMEKFTVYLMGLVHDIGKITTFSELCKQFEANGEDNTPGYNAFVPLMKVLSPAVSYWVAKDWELPANIVTALAEQVNISAGTKVSEYGNLLCHANLCAEAYFTVRQQDKQLANEILKALKLPGDLYNKLDQLMMDV